MRADFLRHMQKTIPEFIKDDSTDEKDLLTLADKMCVEREERYIVERCNEYELPLFDVPTNAHLYE